MITEDTILIENYLKDLLSDQERTSFEERLISDPKFREEFILEKQLNDSLREKRWSFVDKGASEVLEYEKALKQEHLKNLKQTLSEVNSEFNSKPKKANKVYYYLAAASIVIFLGFQLFFNKTSNQDLYNNNVNLRELPSFVTRDITSELDKKLSNGEMYFDTAQYQKSLDVFEPILEDNKTNTLLYTYVGLAQIELELYDESEKTFNDMIANNKPEAHVAYWYKALLYIKSNDTDKALKQLNIIIKNPENYNYNKALELIKKIKL